MKLPIWSSSKKTLLLVATIFLGSCAVNYNYPIGNKTISCKPMVLPEFPSIPDVPYLTESEANSRSRTDVILVAKIKELREYSKRVQKNVEDAHRKHLESCQ